MPKKRPTQRGRSPFPFRKPPDASDGGPAWDQKGLQHGGGLPSSFIAIKDLATENDTFE